MTGQTPLSRRVAAHAALCIAALAGLHVLVAGAGEHGTVDRAFDAFFRAADPQAAAVAAGAIVSAGVDVDTALARLRAGRSYGPEPTGDTTMRIAVGDGSSIENLITIPAGYTPGRRWPVRVQLHGGVSRPATEPGETPRPLTPNRIAGEEVIYIQPRAHGAAEWWHLNQYENMVAILDRVKRRYNVDENRVYLTGISDGATGVYFFAMKLATPFSAFLPLNGNMRVLSSPSTRANGQMYAGNMVNKPFFVINGGRDRLYPVSAVAPHIEMMTAAGATVDFRPQPDAGHDTSWWPTEREAFARFVEAHPRGPHPAAVTWESERTDRYNRVHWLVIDELGRRLNNDASLTDVNVFSGDNGPQRLFARTWPSGRVDARRSGNVFDVRTRGVTSFTILLSPDVIDFSQPVIVRLARSARTSVPASQIPASPAPASPAVFDGLVTQDTRTLLRWAARDSDRTMLYTAALSIRVP